MRNGAVAIPNDGGPREDVLLYFGIIDILQARPRSSRLSLSFGDGASPTRASHHGLQEIEPFPELISSKA